MCLFVFRPYVGICISLDLTYGYGAPWATYSRDNPADLHIFKWSAAVHLSLHSNVGTVVTQGHKFTSGAPLRGLFSGVGDENAESCGTVRPLRIQLVIRPVSRRYDVVVR